MAVPASRMDGPARTSARDPETLQTLWKDRITEGKRDRKRREPAWLMNYAFARGQHHLMWSRTERKLVARRSDDPKRRERYTEDVLTQYLNIANALLGADDERPNIRFREEDIEDRDYAAQANRALAYAWDYEVEAEELLRDLRSILIVLGSGAIQCRFDPTAGPVRQKDVPFQNGQPVLDPEQARSYVLAQQEQGQSANLRSIHEGRLRWRVLSPFQLIVPAGVLRERDFPWEITVNAVHLDKLREEFGSKANDLKADDVASVNVVGGGGESDTSYELDTPRLKDHALLYTCFERPTRDHPEGQTIYLAGAKFDVLKVEPTLPYKAPDQTPRSGITYFHWWRTSDRFWSKSLMDGAKDPQKRINRRRQQIGEIIDRGLPKILVEEGSLPASPEGAPVEVVTLKPNSPTPVVFAGVQPGQWMLEDINATLEGLSRVTGFRDVTLGENPAGVTTYSGLALLRETDQVKMQTAIAGYRDSIRSVVEDTIYDISTYWGSDKQIALAGDEEGMVDAHVFDATKMPSFYLVEVTSGSALPRSQGAQAKLIEAIAQHSIASNQPVPTSWVADSYEAGAPLPLPGPENDVHQEKSEMENQLMVSNNQMQPGQPPPQPGTGFVPPVADYDPIQIHVPEHRKLQVWAEMSGQMGVAAAVASHIEQHLTVQQQQMAAQQAAATGQPGIGPQGMAPPLLPGGSTGAPPQIPPQPSA